MFFDKVMQNVSDDSAKDVKKVAKGAGISFIGSVTGRCLWLLCQVIVARYFNAEVFGLYTLGLMVLKIAELIARFGLHAGAMRFVSIYRKDAPGKVKGIFISASLISFVNGLLLAGIVYFFADFIYGTIFHKPTPFGNLFHILRGIIGYVLHYFVKKHFLTNVF